MTTFAVPPSLPVENLYLSEEALGAGNDFSFFYSITKQDVPPARLIPGQRARRRQTESHRRKATQADFPLLAPHHWFHASVYSCVVLWNVEQTKCQSGTNV